MLEWIVETSGLIQLTFAVLLGWPIYLHRQSAFLQRVIPGRARLLQSHIDDIFMGILHIVLAGHVAKGGPILVGLFIFGSLMNAQIFLFLAFTNDACASRAWFRIVTLFSFASLTVAYLWLLLLQFT